MKKILILILACAFLSCAFIPAAVYADELEKNCKAYYTVDAKTGFVVDGYEIDKKVPIASMQKIMTALLCFEAIDEGKIKFDQKITIIDEASNMGGSQMFLESGDEYTVSELIKGIIVVSANDACVQLACTLSGSEENFVVEMNKRAKELGAKNTNFVNCTGLPAVDQYSTAYDVSLMLRELIKHEAYHEYATIWMEDFHHPDGRITQFVNTNKLIRFYKGCTGGKTGFTNEAGFCLAVGAKRGNTEIVSVVIGARDSKTRFSTATKQLDCAFANYETVNVLDGYGEISVDVSGGKINQVGVHPEKEYFAFVKKGESWDVRVEYEVFENVKAPVLENQVVGVAVITTKTGVERVNLLANNGVLQKNYGEYLRDVIESW